MTERTPDRPKFNLGQLFRAASLGVARRWPLLIVATGSWIAVSLGLSGLGASLQSRQGLEEVLPTVVWCANALATGAFLGLMLGLVVDGALGRPLDLPGVGRRLLRALPAIAVIQLIFEGPGRLGLAAFAGDVAAMGLVGLASTLYNLVLWPLLGVALPAAMDGRATPPAALGFSLYLTRGRRWLIGGLNFALFLIAALIGVAVGMGLAPGNALARAAVNVAAVLAGSFVTAGMYLELRRLRGDRSADVVAETFD